jgi:formylglycine-generating enzyme required for sulfatase activity
MALHRGYTERIPGTRVTFDMVAIPAGTFFIGSPESEKGRSADEGPQRRVSIAAFWMGKCEVTWDEFDLFARRKPPARKPEPADADAVTRPTDPYIDETWGFGWEGYPVIGISHHAAMEYCRWLSAKTGKTYRLPTEAEWEYACRAGTPTARFFGDAPRRLGEYAWFAGNAEDVTHPVGQLRPNPWGLHDLYGNAAEWCLDHYQQDAYSTFPLDKVVFSPAQVPTVRRYPHVVRGGCYADAGDRCRSAARRSSDKSWNKSDPERPQSIWWLADADFVGFRIVRPVEEQKDLRGLRSKVTRESP